METCEYLEAKVDKFVFRVARGYRYNDADVWAKSEGDHVRIGLCDFLQQRSGDVAFVDVTEVGTMLAANGELAVLETIKANLVILAPLAGKIVAVNDTLIEHPELVNSDPYGAGWLAEMEPSHWADFDALFDVETYLPQMQARAELERQK